MSGRLDLVQAESVLGLIESQSRQSAKVALRQLQGHLSTEFERIENDLLWVLAQLEANIDFSSEGIEVTSSGALLARSLSLVSFLEALIGSYQKGRLLREGLQVALVGKPNAGKSSLLNALLREDRSIVTSEAGTTRDLVEGRLTFDGIPVTFVAMARSDYSFYVIDLSSPDWLRDLHEFQAGVTAEHRFVFNKLDLDKSGEWAARSEAELERLGLINQGFWVSSVSRRGLAEIESFLKELVSRADVSGSNVVTQARHLEQLQKIHSCLLKAIDLIKKDASPEFIAFELQEAIRAIHELLGKEFHEQVIDRICKEFCLGT